MDLLVDCRVGETLPELSKINHSVRWYSCFFVRWVWDGEGISQRSLRSYIQPSWVCNSLSFWLVSASFGGCYLISPDASCKTLLMNDLSFGFATLKIANGSLRVCNLFYFLFLQQKQKQKSKGEGVRAVRVKTKAPWIPPGITSTRDTISKWEVQLVWLFKANFVA